MWFNGPRQWADHIIGTQHKKYAHIAAANKWISLAAAAVAEAEVQEATAADVRLPPRGTQPQSRTGATSSRGGGGRRAPNPLVLGIAKTTWRTLGSMSRGVCLGTVFFA